MIAPSQRAGSLLTSALLLFHATALLPQPLRADVLVRAHGRCKLMSGGYNAFNGHCTFKHKQSGDKDAYVVALDDGTEFVFRGPNPNALHVKTYRGLVNVGHNAKADHEVFVWDDGEKRRLLVKLDQLQNSKADFDDNNNAALPLAILGGAAAAALIGSIMSNSGSRAPAEPATLGAPVRGLQDLVGAKGGQAEPNLVRRGYSYRGGSTGIDSKFSFWQQPGTGHCVGIETADGRYQKIVYADQSSCN